MPKQNFPTLPAGPADCQNPPMSYSSVDARQQVLDDLAAATEQLTRAVADLGEAYERMDERSADRLEQSLFRPLQAAYGAAKRTHAEFAARYGIATRALE